MKIASWLKVSGATLALFSFTSLILADELSDAYDSLKKAQESKNVDEVKKWALETSKFARIEAARPKPADATQVDFWKQRVDYASSTDIYTEYALGVAAIMPNLPPEQVVDLVETLLAQSPRSNYLGMALPTYFAALGKASPGPDRQIEAAAKILVAFPDSEDALYTLAEGHLTKNRAEQAASYATRLLSTLISKPKPEGIPDADWNNKVSVLTGRGNYMAGVAGCMREMWSECDKFLRVAVTQVGNQPALAGPAYFYLGLANYRLGKTTNSRALIQEGVRFTTQSAGIVSQMQDKARENAVAMEKDLATKKGK